MLVVQRPGIFQVITNIIGYSLIELGNRFKLKRYYANKKVQEEIIFMISSCTFLHF
ncbi:predicted protein [Enterococcus faecalis JH1]|nr:predicted protein [Enterococcus faecalis JH1]